MEFKFEMVPVNKVHDTFSGINLGDVTATLHKQLTTHELQAYYSGCMKVTLKEKLSRGDAIIFNKIDEITMRTHGMCLKDAAVTKARIGACKRNGIKFIDRDNLIDHMKFMMSL